MKYKTIEEMENGYRKWQERQEEIVKQEKVIVDIVVRWHAKIFGDKEIKDSQFPTSRVTSHLVNILNEYEEDLQFSHNKKLLNINAKLG